MASSTPTQERIVDPFASYNSNVVNKITQIVTQDSDGLLTTNSLQVALDSTSPLDTVAVSTGFLVKDDVLIDITQQHTVDFTDPDQYVSSGMWTQVGYYYLVLDYTYVKSRPAPQASIKILKPGERPSYTHGGQFFLLKVVEVGFNGLTYQIDNLYDYDPSILTNARQYINYFAGTEVLLPTFNQTRDQSRIAYESNRDKFYFGYKTGWGELSSGGVSIDVNTDSTGVAVGTLCYVDDNRDAIPAISTAFNTGADLVVLSIGTALSGEGRGSIAGFVEGVPIEPGLLIDIGDLLFLSDTDAGTVTNIKPGGIYQVVGRSLSQGSVTTPIDMIFSPKLVLATNQEGQITSWVGPDGDGNYYKDINVSALDGTNAFICSWFDNSDHKEIVPVDVEVRNTGNIIRVYMANNTTVVDYLISSGSSIGGAGSGGGGSGVTDHALLTSLDYASSGHIGFAPSPHNNAHHSQTYITALGVTFANLDNNGDVGQATGKVSEGDHTHPEYIDIPSGKRIYFYDSTAPIGYTIDSSVTDKVLAVKGGIHAYNVPGGTEAGTWIQPNHTLSIAEMPSHNHTYTNWTTAILRSGGTGRGINLTTNPTSYTGGGLPHNHGSVYRPYAAVGIIAIRD